MLNLSKKDKIFLSDFIYNKLGYLSAYAQIKKDDNLNEVVNEMTEFFKKITEV